MNNSIQQFSKNGIGKLKKIFEEFSNDPKKVAEMVEGVTGVVLELGTSLIAEEWESYDQLLREDPGLRKGWEIIRRDESVKTTSLGDVRYRKTYFRNKETGKRRYLLDELLGFAKGERLTEDAWARAIGEAVDSSYRKGGLSASIAGSCVSKTAVMGKIHALEFPEPPAPKAKKAVKTLYIDADEDHVALQYLEHKGDLKGTPGKTAMPKLIYVYEGIDTENKRHRLIGTRYFGGLYAGAEKNRELWEEVYRYIEDAYDGKALERIYVSGDGAAWIKEGAKLHGKAKFVLDRFHMQKYIVAATAHLGDSAQDARDELWAAIRKKRKWMAEEAFRKILNVTEGRAKRGTVEDSRTYILGQWPYIMNGEQNRKDNIHCSAEGHVSHVYSSRMSSRPLGWSEEGADKMARLLVYDKNCGDMLGLLRYQGEALPKAAGAEEAVYSATQMLVMEKKRRKELGPVADIPTYSIPYPQIRKIAALKNHIWGL